MLICFFFNFVFVLIKLLQGCVVFGSKRRSKIFELKQISYSLLYYLLQMQYYYRHLKAQTTLLQRPTDGAIDHSTKPTNPYWQCRSFAWFCSISIRFSTLKLKSSNGFSNEHSYFHFYHHGLLFSSMRKDEEKPLATQFICLHLLQCVLNIQGFIT